MAERFTLHPNVARHHLDKLAGGGYVEVATGRTGTGRRAPVEALPRDVAGDDASSCRCATTTCSSRCWARRCRCSPDDAAEAMAEEVGIEYGQAMAAAMGGPVAAAADGRSAQRSFRTALHAVADALTAHGFAAHAERHDNGLRIVSDHCPFGGAAIEHPVICAVDRGHRAGHARRALRRGRRRPTSSSRPWATTTASPPPWGTARRA